MVTSYANASSLPKLRRHLTEKNKDLDTIAGEKMLARSLKSECDHQCGLQQRYKQVTMLIVQADALQLDQDITRQDSI